LILLEGSVSVAKIRFGDKSVPLPGNRAARIALGSALVVAGGLGGWLPILGFWMLPLGLLVLSTDIPAVRRFNRKATVALVGWWKSRKSKDERIAERNGRDTEPQPDEAV
jgi:hypothetical protein